MTTPAFDAAGRRQGKADVTAWRIHLGAHKTATTHLQDTLAAVRGRLVAQGVDFVPNPDLRKARMVRVLRDDRLLNALSVTRRRMIPWRLRRIVEPLRAGPQTVILSEENLLGWPADLLAQPIYPRAPWMISGLAGLADGATLDLFLSVRAPDALLASGYVESLKESPPPGGFAALKRAALAAPPSWSDLVRRLRRAAPGVRLTVWRQEDYRMNARAVAQALCGVDPGPLPALDDPVATRSPSLDAVAAAEALPPDMPRVRRREAVAEIYGVSDPAAPRFAPFEAGERAALRAAYDADLDRLDAEIPGALLRFDEQ